MFTRAALCQKLEPMPRLILQILNAQGYLFERTCLTKTVAEAMNLELDADDPADREKLRRAVLDLVAGRKMPKQKGHG